MPRDSVLITSVANHLLEATASNASEASQEVLAQLVEHYDLSYSFLRHSHHGMRASVLVAEWPPRDDVPDPDPYAVVSFSSHHPAFALCEDGVQPVIVPPREKSARRFTFRRRRSGDALSVAAAPLVSGKLTSGVLGFVRCDGRKWKPDVVNTLEAVASLFAQFQARISAEQKLRHLVEHDDLTGLRNRRALLAHLSERLAAGVPGPVAILYIDLDRLKAINDCLGHSAGDWFIQLFAQRLRACAGSQSMVARLGGDEFVVVPPAPMSIHAAETLANRLLKMLRDRLTIGGHPIKRTVSIGVAVGVPGRDDSSDLLCRADEAVLTAKRAGGNQVAVPDDLALRRLIRNDIELHLQGDIDSKSLTLHYLPEVDLWTGAVVAAEALVRWRHPARGLLLPGSFMGVADSMNLAGGLGHWVLRHACAELSAWRSRGVGRGALLRVNVSPLQLAMRGFVRMVAETMAEFGLDGSSLSVEITERAVVHDVESTRRTLTELKEIGVQIAIDDFGTGYAVLSHLKSLPIDTLKIDRMFVRDLGSNSNDLAIVRAVIGLAEAFHLHVVAEGVETSSAALTLMQHGCHRAQGFLFSRPLPGTSMESLLASRSMPMPFLADREALAQAVT